MDLKTLDDELTADPAFKAPEKARVLAAAVAETERIRAELKIAKTAHLCAEEHVAASVTFGEPPDEWTEVVAGATCHDCGRTLVSDAGTERVLVCPQVHGKRPKKLTATGDKAVECGVPNG